MKKTYINPEMEIVEIKMQQHIMAGSVGINSTATPIDPSTADGHEFDDDFDFEDEGF